MTVAEELWDQLVYLSDPEVKWVQHAPRSEGEACLISRAGPTGGLLLRTQSRQLLSALASAELSAHTLLDNPEPSGWNDSSATREQVLHVLEEAYWWAKEEGL